MPELSAAPDRNEEARPSNFALLSSGWHEGVRGDRVMSLNYTEDFLLMRYRKTTLSVLWDYSCVSI